jgi:hypothetical protein
MNRPPVVAVLAAHWESATEAGWITRQVAGALACVGDVHIVTPDGQRPGRSTDGAFTLHRLATPVDAAAELRRDLLVDSLSSTASPLDRAPASQLAALLDRDLLDPWQGAAAVLAGLRPDHVVIAGHAALGALAACDRGVPGTPFTLLPLGTDRHRVAFPHFRPLFERAASILTVTESERSAVVDGHGRGDDVHRIGAPMAANPSARTEPNGWVGNDEYVLVVTDCASEEDDHPHIELSRLLRMRFPAVTFGFTHTDAFRVWRHGRLHEGWAVERSSDMARLMAWAQTTIDLRPGPLFARRCVDSLLYGTPVVVPDDSVAREHADRGRGGLWFHDPVELAWCVEAMLDGSTRDTLGAQGQAYAEEEYGSTDRFIDRVTAGCGLLAADQGLQSSGGR